MRKFKPGDRIKCLDSGAYDGGVEVGDIGIVAEGHPTAGWFLIKSPTGKWSNKGMRHNDRRWAKLPQTKFKGGDRVSVVECDHLKQWPMWREAIDAIFVLSRTNAYKLNKGETIILGNNQYLINFSPESLERIRR